jgi:hypothetical protein
MRRTIKDAAREHQRHKQQQTPPPTGLSVLRMRSAKDHAARKAIPAAPALCGNEKADDPDR